MQGKRAESIVQRKWPEYLSKHFKYVTAKENRDRKASCVFKCFCSFILLASIFYL